MPLLDDSIGWIYRRSIGTVPQAEGFAEQLVSLNSDLSVKALVTGDVSYATSTTSIARAAAVVKILASFFNGSDYSID